MLSRTVRRRGATLFLAAAGLVAMTATAITAPASADATAGPTAACGSGYVALTYDDGPNPSTTNALLTALRNAGARATFFNMGSRDQQYPDLVRAVSSAGMWVGNHTWSHPHLTQLSRQAALDEIVRTQQVTQQIIGQTPTLFRPPYGETNSQIEADAAAQGLVQVLWTVDSRDWNGASTDQIVAAAATLQPGGIILMHDNYQTTIAAVPRIVADLNARGLCPGKIVSSNGRAVVVAP
jgi:peptidoglycan/xylan/chitin deacetylase (PgdA/CDA1 family)